MGIGNYPDVAIAEVRATALAARQQLKAGIDPIDSRRTAAVVNDAVVQAPSFEDAARATHAEIKPAFKNAKHADQWINTLDDYVFPKLWHRKVDDLRAVDFADVLRPTWLTKLETAFRVKQRCDRVMEWCAARGHVVASPVRVFDSLLPKQPGKRERVTHHPAMPWRDVPRFFQSELKDKPPTPSRQMLELLILTAVRSGEVREMRWNEIDLEKAIWTIPAARMKAKVAHTVPLPSRCVQLLQGLHKPQDPTALVFASRRGTPLSDMALTKLLRDTNAHRC
jgi:integrase